MNAKATEPWAIFTLKELAQMWSAGEELGMSEGIIDITQLPQMFKELDDEVRPDIWWSRSGLMVPEIFYKTFFCFV